MSTTDRNAAAAPNVSSDQNTSAVRSTISRKKLAANRRNARGSIGPRTDEGKAVSSRNAVSHAIFCRDLLVEGESGEELGALRDGIHRALAPRDELERGFVDSVVVARWQLRRLRAAARQVHGDAAEEARLANAARLAECEKRIERECECWGRSKHAAIRAEAEPHRARLATLAGRPITIELTMSQDLKARRSTWERLSRYEQRLEQNVARAMRELRAYRKDLREFGGPAPLGDDVDVDLDLDAPEQAQNEPTDDETAASDDAAGSYEQPPCDTGVPPVRSADETSTAEAAGSQLAEQTREKPARDPSD